MDARLLAADLDVMEAEFCRHVWAADRLVGRGMGKETDQTCGSTCQWE
jgi:hypothetical protein